MAIGIIDVLEKLGYINNEFDPRTLVTWLTIKAGGTRHADDQDGARKEAMFKLTEIFTEVLDLYITQEIEQMALRFDKRQRMQAGDR